MAPSGRIMKPAPNVANVIISDATSFTAGKNVDEICSAYRPKRKKSNISRKLPLVTRNTVMILEDRLDDESDVRVFSINIYSFVETRGQRVNARSPCALNAHGWI